jgi:hypothetical protein
MTTDLSEGRVKKVWWLIACLCIHLICVFPVAYALEINFYETQVGVDVAQINWTTDVDTLGWVNYTDDPLDASKFSVESPGGGKQNHSVSLTSLESSTEYYYAIWAKDVDGAQVHTETLQFTTGVLDTTAPGKIKNFTATALDAITINLDWAMLLDDVDHYELFKNDSSYVNLSVDQNYYQDTDVVENTNYEYGIRAVDAFGNAGAIVKAEADTPNYIDFEIEYVEYEVKNLQVVVNWLTSKATTSKVWWGTSISMTTAVDLGNESEFTHAMTLQADNPGVMYYFKVESCDANDCLVSDVYNFTTGNDSILYMNLSNIPGWENGMTYLHNAEYIDIEGMTKSFTDMLVYVNNMVTPKFSTSTGHSGEFSFGDIALDVNESDTMNQIRFELTDTNGDKLNQHLFVDVDIIPPFLNISTEIPPFLYNPNFKFDAIISEDGNVTVRVVPEVLPELGSIQDANMTVDGVEGNSIKLDWEDVEDDFKFLKGYAMYVDDLLIDVATTSEYTFEELRNNTQYRLGVAPVDRFGNIRDDMSITTITTQEDGENFSGEFEEYDVYELLPFKSKAVRAGDNLYFTVELVNGRNSVEVIAQDLAGNQFVQNFSIVYDAEPPAPELVFPRDNANIYEIPAMDVDIEGVVNDPEAKLYLYVDCQLYSMGTVPAATPDENGKYAFEFSSVNLLIPNVILNIGNATGAPPPPSGSLFDFNAGQLIDQDNGATTFAIDTHNLIDVDSWDSWEANAPEARAEKVPGVFPGCTGPTNTHSYGKEYNVKAHIVAIDPVGRMGEVEAQYHIKNCLSGNFSFVPQVVQNRQEPAVLSARRIESGVERIGFYIQFEYVGDDEDVAITSPPAFKAMVDDEILKNEEPYKSAIELIPETPSAVVPLGSNTFYVSYSLRRKDNVSFKYDITNSDGDHESAFVKELKFPIQTVIRYQYTNSDAPSYGGSQYAAPGAPNQNPSTMGAPPGYPTAGAPGGYDPNAYSQQQYGSGYGNSYGSFGTGYTSSFSYEEQTVCFEVAYPLDSAQIDWQGTLPDWLLYDVVGYLNTTVHWLNKAIEFLDEYIITYVLYACVFSLLARAAWGIFRRISCHYSLKGSGFTSALKAITNKNSKPNEVGGIYCPGSEVTTQWATTCNNPDTRQACFSDLYNMRLSSDSSRSSSSKFANYGYNVPADNAGFEKGKSSVSGALAKMYFKEKYVSDYELKQCFPSCFGSWKTEQAIYKLYRFFCDRVWCASTPSRWTEGMPEGKLYDLQKLENENRCDVDDGSIGEQALRGRSCSSYLKAPYTKDKTYGDLLGGSDASQRTTYIQSLGSDFQFMREGSHDSLMADMYCYEYNYNGKKALYILKEGMDETPAGGIKKLYWFLGSRNAPRTIPATGNPPNLKSASFGSCQELCDSKRYSGYGCMDKQVCSSQTAFRSTSSVDHRVCPTSANDPNCKRTEPGCLPVAPWSKGDHDSIAKSPVRMNPSYRSTLTGDAAKAGPSGCGQSVGRTLTESMGESFNDLEGNKYKCMGNPLEKPNNRVCCCWHAQVAVPPEKVTEFYPYVDNSGKVSGSFNSNPAVPITGGAS